MSDHTNAFSKNQLRDQELEAEAQEQFNQVPYPSDTWPDLTVNITQANQFPTSFEEGQ
jgi:hypothetical protein